MRKLERPAQPDWFGPFADEGRKELERLVDSVVGKELSPSYLRKTRLYDPRRMFEIKLCFHAASNGTCHACESPTDVEPAVLDQYRPMLFAGNERRDRTHPRHYWWLMYEWDNFQLLCPYCNRYKGSLFPVRSMRAPDRAVGEKLEAEGALLFNPFDSDLAHQFDLTGKGELLPMSEAAKVTIEVYNLNRPDLCASRHQLRKEVEDLTAAEGVATVGSRAEKATAIGLLKSLVAPAFAGAAGLVLQQAIGIRSSAQGPERESLPAGAAPQAAQRRPSARRAPKASADASKVRKAYETSWIRSVTIRDFGPIFDLDLAFPDPHENLEPWLGIVGENGVGKSTFLKAVALTLADEKEAARLVPNAGTWFNRASKRRGGFVEVSFSNGKKRRMNFSRHSRKFDYEGADLRIPVIAFGAYRITDRKGSARGLKTSGAIDNLFDPILPLQDAEKWLADTQELAAIDFCGLASNLKILMGLPVETQVTRNRGQIFFKRGENRLSLSEMSDGYRSVIGLAVHIMKHLAPDTPVMSEAEGTVLLDELELHLHPRWKVQIVGKLRELFPRVRFVISTHDPLCLRGLMKNESFAFRRDPETDRIVIAPLSLMPGMDIDDLLTGGWFGLGTTYDVETENMIRELGALQLKADSLQVRHDTKLEPREAQVLESLRSDLRAILPGFGGSHRELEALSDVARKSVPLAEVPSLDTDKLKSRLEEAFAKREPRP